MDSPGGLGRNLIRGNSFMGSMKNCRIEQISQNGTHTQ